MLKILNKLELNWAGSLIYHLSLVSLGILIGARFYSQISGWVVAFLVIFLAGLFYIGQLWWRVKDK